MPDFGADNSFILQVFLAIEYGKVSNISDNLHARVDVEVNAFVIVSNENLIVTSIIASVVVCRFVLYRTN